MPSVKQAGYALSSRQFKNPPIPVKQTPALTGGVFYAPKTKGEATMRLRFTGPSARFRDAGPQFEEVRDDDWGPENPQPMSDGEICRMSPEQYRQWVETGRKPLQDEQPVISGEGRPATNEVKLDEPSTETQTTGMTSEIREAYAASGTYAPGVADVAANERFARASDRMHGYRGALTADELAGLTATERFAAQSAHKWASHDPLGRVADRRHRRSE
jgi:hypothetical protein